jgi:hypothetical protein
VWSGSQTPQLDVMGMDVFEGQHSSDEHDTHDPSTTFIPTTHPTQLFKSPLHDTQSVMMSPLFPE